VLVSEVIEALRQRFEVTAEEAAHVEEDMIFKLPRSLVACMSDLPHVEIFTDGACKGNPGPAAGAR
jgi:hypothetical protein